MKVKAILLVCLLFIFSCKNSPDTINLLLVNGKIWTGNELQPWAEWIAIDGDELVGIGEGVAEYSAEDTIDLKGQLTLPGFNDSHVHFASAGALLLGINLLDVSNEQKFVERIKGATERLPKGTWITRGDWGAYESWEVGSVGDKNEGTSFMPNRQLIDDFTSNHPVLVTKFDRTTGMANQLALEHLGVRSNTGILRDDQLTDALKQIPEKSFELLVAEADRAFQECRKFGVTTVQDMSPLKSVDVYKHLEKEGKMTARLLFSPSRLSDYKMMIDKGWVIDWSDPNRPQQNVEGFLGFGTIKSHIDGIMGARSARFYGPYNDNPMDQPDWRGGWREFSKDLPSFKDMLIKADEGKIQLRVHAIGDEANAILLDILDTLEQVNGSRERRFRLVHAQVIAQQDFDRFAGKRVVAEVQPYHVTDDMRWMEERIGYERCKGAYAFKTLQEHDCHLSFGSDWPGTNASYYPINPLMGIYAAVTRQTVNGEPENGWFPEQKISLEEALKAYTHGSAFGAFEEHIKGTMEVGKLADICVLDTDLFKTAPKAWLDAKVVYTILGGEVVYKRN